MHALWNSRPHLVLALSVDISLLHNMHTSPFWGVTAPFSDYVGFIIMSLYPKILKNFRLIPLKIILLLQAKTKL